MPHHKIKVCAVFGKAGVRFILSHKLSFLGLMAHSDLFRPVRTSSRHIAVCHPGVAVNQAAPRPEISMTTFIKTRPAVDAIASTARLSARLSAGLRHWVLRRQTRVKLHRLDDHLLKDIGLKRADIDRLEIRAHHDAMRRSG